jgi:hypothetical protein
MEGTTAWEETTTGLPQLGRKPLLGYHSLGGNNYWVTTAWEETTTELPQLGRKQLLSYHSLGGNNYWVTTAWEETTRDYYRSTEQCELRLCSYKYTSNLCWDRGFGCIFVG